MSNSISGASNYKVPFLKDIVYKYESADLPIKSSYYQNIIRFLLKNANSYYKIREVANYVVLNTQQRIKKNKDPKIRNKKKHIIEDREKTLRRYFSNLVSWKILIERETMVEKGKGSTFEYKLTRFGTLIALLIEMGFVNNKKNSFRALYEFLMSYINEESYSLDYFCKIYLRRIRDASIFNIFIEYLRKNIIYENKCIVNENDLFTYMILLRTTDKRLNRKLWKLWECSFNELNREIQTLFSHLLKIRIDSIIDETILDYGHYEDVLFGQKDKFDTVVVEYRCLKCDDDFCFYRPISILDYLQDLFQGVKSKKLINPNGTIRCTQCDQKILSFTII